MGAALLVVPALTVAWVWAAPRARVRGLLGGGLAMVVAGGAWPLLIALTPASSRPWISGTSDNSIWSLITGYNGLGRLDGQAGGPGGGMGGGGGGGVFGGDTGVLPAPQLRARAGRPAGCSGSRSSPASRWSSPRGCAARDPVTGWILAVGGSALTAAVAFSTASGIFHPYYVSELAPFVAALVGAGVVRFARGDMVARVAGPLAIAGGVITELKVLSDNQRLARWLPPLLVVVGVVSAGALAFGPDARTRNAALATAIATLLIAPATWSVQTLGHATSGTFPAGGPASAAMGGMGGPGGGGGRGGFGGGQGAPPAGGQFGGPPGANGGSSGTAPGGAGGTTPGAGGGGMFGGNSASLTCALAYIKANGGGTLAVSSQSTAAAAIVDSDADIVGIGGFSGRESEVSVSWLADQVRQGNIRWVLADDSGGGDCATTAAPARRPRWPRSPQVGTAVDADGVTLYDLQGASLARSCARARGREGVRER